KLAKKFGLLNHDKKDSQGVCFVGQLNMKEFLKNYIKSKPGKIILTETAQTIGRHDGAYYYTIGQRHGLDIKDGGGPYYVMYKDIKKNILYVAAAKQISRLRLDLSRQAKIEKTNWIAEKPKFPISCQVKIRYRSKSTPAVITQNTKNKTLLIKFKKPVRALTPGQSAVFYRGDIVLGGGILI
ncbi:MAG: tRNA 2-thiouridine(34) synthase MnmA, partial [Candidatus Yanofskybacteria bacterium]|nr:tRNA 2-thiouridine(34) synthase MnmA [Candidatus Yanofskybacteria bacterium]